MKHKYGINNIKGHIVAQTAGHLPFIIKSLDPIPG